MPLNNVKARKESTSS